MSLLSRGRVKREDVGRLKTSLTSESVPELSDEQAALYLLACEGRHDDAVQCVVKNYALRQQAPQLFANRRLDDAALRNQLQVQYATILPKRTSKNYALMVVRLIDFDHRKFDYAAHVKLMCMVLDAVVLGDPPDGLVTVCDFTGMGFGHLTTIKFGVMRVFLRYIQECIPLKIKAVHWMNGGYVANLLFNTAKPFLKRHIRELLHFEEVDSHVEKECLPEEYGGLLPPLSIHHKDTVDKLASMQSYFEAEEKQRLTYYDSR